MTGNVDRLTAALAGRFIIQRELGQGRMATVYPTQDRDTVFLRHRAKRAGVTGPAPCFAHG